MADSRVIEITSDVHFSEELSNCPPNKLVVVDFFATW